ncbi:OLC1v1018066C1 [Oldenlandia corymbosa var. corymbosa]|uniref:OLC1v1018066C1 n=1 Tax=Oldenlandia corymbosa var. corymbosa TaxID=529605 RepID=A0AAV1EAR6_OLDCO|nr:OLC1v1018066C1 [Oldenlandia corymbosa var. corymbosa]
MASSSGNSSGSVSSQIQNSGSEGDLQLLMDQRKRKRMQSNRESARRSRMRKQKHLDDLTAQVAQLSNENSQILSTISATTQQYLNVEADNSVLRAQMMELSQRLESLNEILNYINGGNNSNNNNCNEMMFQSSSIMDHHLQPNPETFMTNPWNSIYPNQPIMASAAAADMFHY